MLGGKVKFPVIATDIAAGLGISQHALRSLAATGKMEIPPVRCVCSCPCQKELSYEPHTFRSRAHLQEFINSDWNTRLCGVCQQQQAIKQAERRKQQEAERAERRKQEESERAAKRQKLRERYGDRVISDCPQCDGVLIVRKSKNGGVFVGCSEYPDCKHTQQIPKPVQLTETDKSAIAEAKALLANAPKCPECSAPMHKLKGKFGIFYGCVSYPACRYTETLETALRKMPLWKIVKSRAKLEFVERHNGYDYYRASCPICNGAFPSISVSLR